MTKQLAADPIAGSAVLTASAVWPFSAEEQAPAALRAQLREVALDRHQAAGGIAEDAPVLDWSTLTVTGPAPDVDHRGHTWFRYTATVSAMPLPRAVHRIQSAT